MAVYTHINKTEIQDFLSQYNVGNCIELTPIAEGVENTNYRLDTERERFILTIFEKRVNKNDLPFFMEVHEHLSRKNFVCPKPVKTKNHTILNTIKNKPCVIISFLDGKSKKRLQNEDLKELGTKIAHMHNILLKLKTKRQNNLSLQNWQTLYNKVKNRADEVKAGLGRELKEHFEWIESNWPDNLPEGIIHGDLFPDNVFFDKNNEISGIIDFYFACNDFLMYDIAICLNAWCFESPTDFNVTKARHLLSSYNNIRPITERELQILPVLASGAAMRFLLTRLYDWLHQVDGALVKPKNPIEYLHKLRFHHGVTNHTKYGL